MGGMVVAMEGPKVGHESRFREVGREGGKVVLLNGVIVCFVVCVCFCVLSFVLCALWFVCALCFTLWSLS